MTVAYIIVSVEGEPRRTIAPSRYTALMALRGDKNWSQEAEDQLVEYLKRSEAWLINEMKSNEDGLRLLKNGRSPRLIVTPVYDGDTAGYPLLPIRDLM